jgi:hypothetical protein
VDPIDIIFQHLDRWRHLPAYALERRADVFFSVYLKGFIEDQSGIALEDEILPELPLKHSETARSVKVDFVIFPKDRERVFFLELKTDPKSRRDRQDEYLLAAQAGGFRRIVEGIREIFLRTDSHQKYFHLACALERLGFLRMPSEVESFLYSNPRRGQEFERCLQAIEVMPHDPPIKVIYLQPIATNEPNCLGFEQFARYIGRFSDPFSQRFAERLLAWKEAAGATPPALVRSRTGTSLLRG